MNKTNAERLERFKNIPSHVPLNIRMVTVRKDDFDWLIEQAELAIYNEQALINQEHSSDREIERLREVNERYQKGLEHYERAEFVKTEKEREVFGRVARQILQGESDD